MLKFFKNLVSIILFLSIVYLNTNLSFATNEFQWGTIIQEKIIGVDRFDTAVKVSELGWYNSEKVIIVNSTAISDALCVAPYAESIKAPILYSNKDSVPDATLKELIRLKTKEIILIGGEAVLSPKVEQQMNKLGYKVSRIYGQDRYKTSMEVARAYVKEQERIRGVAIVNGQHGLADALSISSYACEFMMPIIYSNGTDLSIVDNIYNLNLKGATEFFLLGSEKMISKEIEETITNYNFYWGPHTAKRIDGNNAKEVNGNALKAFYSKGTTPNMYISERDLIANIFVVKDGINNQSELVDGLAIGALAGRMNVPILLASNNLSQSQKEYLSANNIIQITQVGGGANEKSFNEASNIQNSVPLENIPKYDDMKLPTIQIAPQSKIKIKTSYGAPIGGSNISYGEIEGDLYVKYGDPKLGAHHYGVNNQMQYDKSMQWLNRVISTTNFRESSAWVYLQHYINSNDSLPDDFVDPVLESKGIDVPYRIWKAWYEYFLRALEKNLITIEDAESMMIYATVLSTASSGKVKSHTNEYSGGAPHSIYDDIYRGLSDCDASAQFCSAVADIIGLSSFVGGTDYHAEQMILFGNYWWDMGFSPIIYKHTDPFKAFESILSAPTYNLEHLYNKSKSVENTDVTIDFME